MDRIERLYLNESQKSNKKQLVSEGKYQIRNTKTGVIHQHEPMSFYDAVQLAKLVGQSFGVQYHVEKIKYN